MASTVTPSANKATITDGQIDKAVDMFRAALRKHRFDFSSDAAQKVLGVDNLGMELLAPFRTRVEAASNLIVRKVAVNRSRTPQEMLNATGRSQYTDKDVVKAMPKGEAEEVEVFFFNLGRYVSDTDLQKEYERRGLKAADPYSLGAVNEADPAFADEHPNGTHWKDARGNWCFASFCRWYDGRVVRVYRSDFDWFDRWWFAGVRIRK